MAGSIVGGLASELVASVHGLTSGLESVRLSRVDWVNRFSVSSRRACSPSLPNVAGSFFVQEGAGEAEDSFLAGALRNENVEVCAPYELLDTGNALRAIQKNTQILFGVLNADTVARLATLGIALAMVPAYLAKQRALGGLKRSSFRQNTNT